MGGLAVAVSLLALAVTPAGAVQSTTFGISPAPGSPQSGGDHMEASSRPGQPVRDALLVWNRTDKDLTLDLSVQPAHLSSRGIPGLGGAAAPAHWVKLDQSTVTLRPHAIRQVTVTVTVPRILPHLPAYAAVVARPASTTSGTVAVIMQLAVLLTINAAPHAQHRAPIGWIGWGALVLLVLAGLTSLATRWHASRPRAHPAGSTAG